MRNNKGMGLLGLLIAVVIMSVLLAMVLKRYTGQTQRLLNLPAAVAPAQHTGKAAGAAGAQGKSASKPLCNGRLVGNICVPTEVRSSSLDAFEQLSK